VAVDVLATNIPAYWLTRATTMRSPLDTAANFIQVVKVKASFLLIGLMTLPLPPKMSSLVVCTADKATVVFGNDKAE
jgi:hypothetical protein